MTTFLFSLGLSSLIVGFLCAGIQTLTQGSWQRYALWGCTAALSIALLTLMSLFCLSDISVAAISQHSHPLDPLLYKIAATWSHHEGSMVLWCFFLSGYGLLLSLCRLPETPWLRFVYGFQGGFSLFFIGYVLLLSNPFTHLAGASPGGGMLNPLLQDPAVTYHPPLLYLGYVGLSIPAAMGLAAFFRPLPDNAGINGTIRLFLLLPWTFLTLGITFGSLWAYYELGWGGFWFWDPVENLSILPWITATAALHLRPLTAQSQMQRWRMFLLCLPFLMSFLGSTLVRSGALISVHSFAEDPRRGLALALGWGIACTLTAVGLWRQKTQLPAAPLSPLQGLLTLQQLVWGTIFSAILLGTLYPLLLSFVGAPPIAVGTPFYVITVVPFALLLLALLTFLPLATQFPTASWPELFWRESGPWLLSSFATLSLWFFWRQGTWVTYLTLFLAIAVFISTWRLPQGWRSVPLIVAHMGVVILAIGVAVESTTRVESMVALSPGQTTAIGPYTLAMEDMSFVPGENYFATRVTLAVTKDGRTIRLRPERRYFPVAGRDLAETALYTTPFQIWYAALGAATQDDAGAPAWPVRFYVHTLTPWIWVGGILMALGGLLGCLLAVNFGRVWQRFPSINRFP